METLIRTDGLESRRSEGDVLVCDVRFSLTDREAGRRAYLDAHLPGALFVDLEGDLSGPIVPGKTGRHPLPDSRAWSETLGRLGVTPDTFVVAYDDAAGAFAARLWWMLRAFGHSRVSVLDGGYAAWLAEGRPTTGEVLLREAAPPYPGAFEARFVASVEEVERCSRSAAPLLFDARATDRYRGENESIDLRPGHIPRARSLPFSGNLEGGRLANRETVRARFASALDGAAPEDAIVYCGSGVTACHLVLAAEEVGLRGIRLFPGSYSEWIADGTRPVETG